MWHDHHPRVRLRRPPAEEALAEHCRNSWPLRSRPRLFQASPPARGRLHAFVESPHQRVRGRAYTRECS
eukprot:7378678-Prymnesium_polylepis.1